MAVEKYIKDGKVAVLYSPGFGAGWVSWNTEHSEYLAFDKDLVKAVIDGDLSLAAELAESRCDIYTGGARDLKIEWLNPGDMFEIEEYDGNESVHVIGNREYLVA